MSDLKPPRPPDPVDYETRDGSDPLRASLRFPTWSVLRVIQRMAFGFGIAFVTASLVAEGTQLVPSGVGGALIGFGALGWEPRRG